MTKHNHLQDFKDTLPVEMSTYGDERVQLMLRAQQWATSRGERLNMRAYIERQIENYLDGLTLNGTEYFGPPKRLRTNGEERRRLQVVISNDHHSMLHRFAVGEGLSKSSALRIITGLSKEEDFG